MSGGATIEHIDAVDAFARTLYLRAKQSSTPSLAADVALAVRQLHLALRHLRVEAAASDSPLNRADTSVYASQLKPIAEDCDFALKQLETVLDWYGNVGDRQVAGMQERVTSVRSRLVQQKNTIDMFLNSVQLNNPPKHCPGAVAVNCNEPRLENIKQKVDAIARRLFSRRDCSTINDDDGMWQEFKTELEKEGFSPLVLQKHKEILRAYIRELESLSDLNGGAPPTVQGMLECEAQAGSRELVYSAVEHEKYATSMRTEQRMPYDAPMPSPNRELSFDGPSSSPDRHDSDINDSLALISTMDLVAMDRINSGMVGMHLQPPGVNYGLLPTQVNQRYLPPGTAAAIHPSATNELSRSANSRLLGTSPQHLPQQPHYGHDSNSHTYGSSAPSGYGPGLQMPQMPQLAPDSYGRHIPMEAQWTKIKRSLVSPEVLHRAGVRYEARPGYVAVLGRLSREQIVFFAQQSAECRASRVGNPSPQQHKSHHARADSKSSRDDDEDDDDESVLWDETDTTDYDDDKTSDKETKGTKSYPYIVSPPTKTSPASTVKPKPILKNKNTNHVRFDPEPHEVESPNSPKDDRGRRDSHSRKGRDHRDHRDRYDRNDSGRHRDQYSSANNDYHRPPRKSDRSSKKKWGGTLGMVGIGGAAASLLGVLAEAAIGI